jgi:hypothetical protein
VFPAAGGPLGVAAHNDELPRCEPNGARPDHRDRVALRRARRAGAGAPRRRGGEPDLRPALPRGRDRDGQDLARRRRRHGRRVQLRHPSAPARGPGQRRPATTGAPAPVPGPARPAAQGRGPALPHAPRPAPAGDPALARPASRHEPRLHVPGAQEGVRGQAAARAAERPAHHRPQRQPDLVRAAHGRPRERVPRPALPRASRPDLVAGPPDPGVGRGRRADRRQPLPVRRAHPRGQRLLLRLPRSDDHAARHADRAGLQPRAVGPAVDRRPAQRPRVDAVVPGGRHQTGARCSSSGTA